MDGFVFSVAVLALLLSPVAFGSVHCWAYSILELVVFTLVLLFFFGRVFSGYAKHVEIVRTPVDIFIALFFAWVLFQVSPIPRWALHAFSPVTFRDKMELLAFFEGFAHTRGIEYSPDFLAYYRHPVFQRLLKIASCASMFFLVVNTANTGKRLNLLIHLLVFSGLFQALYGLFQVFGQERNVLWFSRPYYKFASGTFIVSNHFAFYLAMSFLLTLGLLVAQRKTKRDFSSGFDTPRARVQAVVGWFSPESSNPKRLFLFFVAVMQGTALIMSGSRGGNASVAVALLAISILFLTKKRLRKTAAVSMLVCLGAFASAAYTGMDSTLNKFGRAEEGFEGRLCISLNMLPMLMDYPVAGVGLGNFPYIYPRYQSLDCPVLNTSPYSHNDWLEIGTDTGCTGLFVVGAAVVLFLVKIVQVWKKRRNLYALGIGAGTMACVVAACLHSLGDLNMHIPSNSLTLAAVAGIGFLAVHMRDKGFERTFFCRKRKLALAPAARMAVAVCLLLVYGIVVRQIADHFRAEAKCPTEWNSTLNLDWNPEEGAILEALNCNPANAEIWRKLAIHYIWDKAEDENRNRQNIEKAIDALLHSLALNSTPSLNWYNLGNRFLVKDYDIDDYYDKWVPLADQCFDFAVKNEPSNADILFRIAKYWVWRSKKLEDKQSRQSGIEKDDRKSALKPGTPVLCRKQGIEKFEALFQESLAINPWKWKEAIERVWQFYPREQAVLRILPKGDFEMEKNVLKWLYDKQQPE